MTSKRPNTKSRVRQAATAPAALECVTLLREHQHQGECHPAGAQISVHPETAQWLRAQGVISNSPQKD